MKLEKASGKAGRDSSLTKLVFGKMESVVSFTKFKREILVVVALLCRFVLPDSTRFSKGMEQQPVAHASEGSSILFSPPCSCLLLSLSPPVAFISLPKYLWMKKSMAFHGKRGAVRELVGLDKYNFLASDIFRAD